MKKFKEWLFIITVGVAVLAVIFPFLNNNSNDNSIVQVGKLKQLAPIDNSITILHEEGNDDESDKSMLKHVLFPIDYQPFLGQNNVITVMHVTVANSDEDNDNLVKAKTEGTCVGITIDILIRVVSPLTVQRLIVATVYDPCSAKWSDRQKNEWNEDIGKSSL